MADSSPIIHHSSPKGALAPYLEVFKSRRVAVVLLLGFASGLPLALTGSTLQAWLTVTGVEIRTIAWFSWIGVPYLLKFLWSPLMDRFIPPWLGRRRGWIVTTHASGGRRAAAVGGAHGYHPGTPDMRALFVAAGPSLRRGLVVPDLANVHLYEFMCRILQLTPAKNDGDLAKTAEYFAR